MRRVRRVITTAALVLLAAAVGFGLAVLIPDGEGDPTAPHPTLVGTSTIPPPQP
jgi:hypothetical protein